MKTTINSIMASEGLMNTPDPVPTPAAIAVPWYKSRILQGLLTIVVSQLVARVQTQFHIDFMGMSVTDIVNWLMDAITAAAIYWATHARVAPQIPIPPVITLSRSAADQINANPTENKP